MHIAHLDPIQIFDVLCEVGRSYINNFFININISFRVENVNNRTFVLRLNIP